ncbi:MAG: hypothetical protein RR877_10005 [Aurantimicrobium sp.]|uniref:hypothetical protein n=1 Tax=Aurantimicrobium sp. TaxID=1930784 RepID=UPI002FC84497
MGVLFFDTTMVVAAEAVAVPIAGSAFMVPAGCTKSGVRLSRFCDFIHESLSGLLVVGFERGNFRAANGLALVAFWVSYAHWGSIGFQWAGCGCGCSCCGHGGASFLWLCVVDPFKQVIGGGGVEMRKAPEA